MSWKIIWSEFAEKQVELIYKYYEKNASKKMANNLIRSIITEPNKILKDPFLGQKENFSKIENSPTAISY